MEKDVEGERGRGMKRRQECISVTIGPSTPCTVDCVLLMSVGEMDYKVELPLYDYRCDLLLLKKSLQHFGH